MVPHDKDKDNPSELIRGKDVAAFGLWSLPSFDEPRDEPAVAAPQVPAVAEPAPAPPAVEEVELETVKPPTLEEIEAIRQDAYNEGFATGERDGFHAGQLKARQEAEEALKERLQSLERLMTQLLEPIAEQDALIEQGMVNHVARQVIQRELHMDSSHVREAVSLPAQPVVEGRLLRMVGLTLEAEGLQAAVGSRCNVINESGYHPVQVEAEVMGFSGSKVYLMPVGSLAGIAPGARVVPLPDTGRLPMGMSMLGRVLDGAGRALDGKGGMRAEDWVPMDGPTINPLKRHPISEPLDVGIRSINGLLTVGRGQRLGLFAGTGVGKSVLLGMMTRFTRADIIVVGLIGERGREVKEFIDEILGEEGLKRSVVVASPADDAPLMRLRAAQYCTRIAEYFRDKGKNVLLLMDSLTRYAQAQREIALAIGEPPATKGYPPSVFAKLPKLVERAGNAEAGGGSITAFYTVLSEGDDQQDPIADAARGVLDGHFVLSRRLAEEGHYPAIDIEASISRVMPQVVEAEHLRDAQRFKQLWSRYQQSRDLISVGAYVAGGDPETDLAIARFPVMRQFLRQGLDESESLAESRARLASLLAGGQA